MNKNNCDDMPGWHRFFEVSKITSYNPGYSMLRANNEGVRVVCCICGEIRELWKDGKIDIIKPNPHAEASNTENSKPGGRGESENTSTV